jgi:hypothetical protein
LVPQVPFVRHGRRIGALAAVVVAGLVSDEERGLAFGRHDFVSALVGCGSRQ